MNQKTHENKLEQIELEYRVENIFVNKIAAWPMLRFHYFTALTNIKHTKPRVKYCNAIRSMFYGWRNLFGSYKYLYFSDSAERKFLEGRWIDKSIDFIYSTLGDGLLFELPLPLHKAKQVTGTKNITSKLLLYALASLYSLLFLKRIKIVGEEILADINQSNHLSINYRSIIKKHVAFYAIGRLLVTLYRPKAVFLQCSYTNSGMVKAFRDVGITVVEIQHGIITKTHGAYNVYKKADDHYFPEYILTFGEKEKEIFNRSNYFIDPQNVKPVGHFYIDYLNNLRKTDPNLQTILAQYKKSVTISSQDLEEERQLIQFLKNVAQNSPEIIFLFFPRFKTADDYKQFEFPSNIIFIHWLNIYEAIIQTDFHATMYSTCAIEAPSLGVRNILININRLSEKHFAFLLDYPEINLLANSPEEFIHHVHRPNVNKAQIKDANKYHIKPGYKENMHSILQDVLRHKHYK